MSSSSPASSAASPETERAGRKYKGVRLRKWGKWVSEIRLPNSRDRVWLGSYDAPEKAARAFDAAFVCLRGSQAANADCLNFPGSPPPPCRRSLDPREVQAAALSHANRATAVYDSSLATATAPSTDPWFATQDIFGGGGEVVVAQDEGMDWEAVVAHQPPLFSPTAGWGGTGSVYDFFEAPLPEDDDVQMDERDHAASASLWSFDPRDSYFRY